MNVMLKYITVNWGNTSYLLLVFPMSEIVLKLAHRCHGVQYFPPTYSSQYLVAFYMVTVLPNINKM